jgi:hypothetical protein
LPLTNLQASNARSTFSAFEELASALQSNNLSAAQQAYNTLSSMMPNAASGSGSSSPFDTAFQALGQALQSGNLQGAQQAFSNLQQDAIQGAGMGGHHHHHHGGGGGQVQNSSSSNNVPDSLFNNSSSNNSNSNSSSSNSQSTNQLDLLNLLA